MNADSQAVPHTHYVRSWALNPSLIKPSRGIWSVPAEVWTALMQLSQAEMRNELFPVQETYRNRSVWMSASTSVCEWSFLQTLNSTDELSYLKMWEWELCQSARAAITKWHHRLRALQTFSVSSRGWKFKIRVLADLVSPKTSLLDLQGATFLLPVQNGHHYIHVCPGISLCVLRSSSYKGTILD